MVVYGTKGFPWTSDLYKENVSYNKGICPTAESMNEGRYINIGLGLIRLDQNKCDLIVEAFKKVWDNLDSLGSK